MEQIDKINFGLLTEQEILTLKHRLQMEERKRIENTDEYYEVVRAEDGSEGFYVKKDDFRKIDPHELLDYIAQTLECGSDISFNVEKIEKKEYDEHCERYEWNFGNAAMNEEDDE